MLELLIECLPQFESLWFEHNLFSYPLFLLLLQFILLQFCYEFFLLPLLFIISQHPTASLVQSRLLDRVGVLYHTLILIRSLVAAVKQHFHHPTSCWSIRLGKSVGVAWKSVSEIVSSPIRWVTACRWVFRFLGLLWLHIIPHVLF